MIRNKCLLSLPAKFIPSVEEILEKSISQSFSHFRFSQDADVNIPSFAAMNPAYQGDDDESFHEGGEPMDDFPHEDEPAAADFFTGDQAVTDGYDIGMAVDHVEPDAAGSGAIDGFDPRRAPNEHDLVMALAEEGDGMMDYFDSTVMKNWAGPEHWKLRRGPKKSTPLILSFECFLTMFFSGCYSRRGAQSKARKASVFC